MLSLRHRHVSLDAGVVGIHESGRRHRRRGTAVAYRPRRRRRVEAGRPLGWRGSGALVTLLGVGGGVGAVAVETSAIVRLSGYVQLLPGIVGAFVLALALVPVRGSGSRILLKSGSALVVLGVVFSGVFQSVSVGTLLLAGAATVVAWDAGEHAINLGEQLGRGRNAVDTEAVHVFGTAVVAFGAVETATFAGVGPSELSLSSFALVLVAVVLLAVALHD